jgi:ABC-type transport system involved in multi-copper enzyme maturation permease subunit
MLPAPEHARTLSFLDPIATIAGYTLLEALRNRLLWLVAVFIGGAFGFTAFVGEVAITESAAFQAGLLGAVLRACAVLTVCLFVITSIVREFDDKVLELTLSLPIPRASYLLGKFAGFCVLSICVAALCGLCLLVHVPAPQALLWSLSLACELVLVAGVSLLCLFTFSNVTLALSAVLAFYVLSRVIGAVELIAHSPIVSSSSLGSRMMEWFVSGLVFLLPALDRFTSSQWLIYHTGTWGEFAPIAGQTAVYLVLLAGAALFDLYRKEL